MSRLETTQGIALITGASGAIGPTVAEAFRDARYRIRTLSRTRPDPALFPPGTESVVGDITQRETLDAAFRQVSVVIHLAALLHVMDKSKVTPEDYERVNVLGSANVLDAARQNGAERFVFLSSIAVYGESRVGLLTEDSTPQPDTPYARTKLAAEKIILNDDRSDDPLIRTALRAAAVYGPRLKGNYRRLVRSLARGRFVPIGGGDNRRTLVHSKDLARAIVLAATHPAAAGRVYNVTDGCVHSLKDIISAISEALGKRPPRLSIPLSAARAIIGAFEDSSRLIGYQAPISRSMIDKYTEDVAVCGRRIQAELDFAPQFDLRTGWKQTVEQMRSMGEL